MAVVRAAPLRAVLLWATDPPVWLQPGIGLPADSLEPACSVPGLAWLPERPDVVAVPPLPIGFVPQNLAAAALAAEFAPNN